MDNNPFTAQKDVLFVGCLSGSLSFNLFSSSFLRLILFRFLSFFLHFCLFFYFDSFRSLFFSFLLSFHSYLDSHRSSFIFLCILSFILLILHAFLDVFTLFAFYFFFPILMISIVIFLFYLAIVRYFLNIIYMTSYLLCLFVCMFYSFFHSFFPQFFISTIHTFPSF